MLIGDAIEKMLNVGGVGDAFKNWFKVRGKDCGCDDRKKMLNDIHARTIVNTKEGLNAIADMYTAITGHKLNQKARRSQCPKCWQNRMDTISKYIKEQEMKASMIEAIQPKPKLKDLRKKHPHIKATSVDRFLEILEEEKNKIKS